MHKFHKSGICALVLCNIVPCELRTVAPYYSPKSAGGAPALIPNRHFEDDRHQIRICLLTFSCALSLVICNIKCIGDAFYAPDKQRRRTEKVNKLVFQ